MVGEDTSASWFPRTGFHDGEWLSPFPIWEEEQLRLGYFPGGSSSSAARGRASDRPPSQKKILEVFIVVTGLATEVLFSWCVARPLPSMG